MLVQLLNSPPAGCSRQSVELVQAWADSLRAAGIEVALTQASAEGWGHPAAAEKAGSPVVAGCAQWAAGPRPDLIHAFGARATSAALRADLKIPVVATFHESPAPGDAENSLANQVHAVVSLSAQEHDRWERAGVTSLSPGPLPTPGPVPDRNACARPDGVVVTLCTGADLDELLDSMAFWQGRLVVMADLTGDRRDHALHAVAARGLQDRVELRPAATAEERAEVWHRAAVLYAGVEGSQHGAAVLEAAAHGVPAVAVSMGAHRDCVVSGTTGLLLAPRAHRGADAVDRWNPGQAIAALLAEPFWIRALGTAALVRVGSAHSAQTSGSQLSELYARALQHEAPHPQAVTACSTEREQLVVEHMALARQLASWYAGRGQSMDDLVQVASLGLVNAARRFDPSHGREFHSFAVPTILGELRRHFRDNAWAVRVPRGLQESTLQVQRAADALSQTLGRPPTVAELAEHLDVVEEDVRLAQQTDGEARSARSLDAPLDSDSFANLLGDEEQGLETVELRQDVRAAIAQLPEREQQILLLRFYGERTQAEIAGLLGISQVHVSRVLSRTLAAIRDYVMDDVPLSKA